MRPTKEAIVNELSRRRMSQTDLARQTGIDKTIISRLLSGDRELSPQYVHAISRALTPDWVWAAISRAQPLLKSISEELEML